MCAAENDLGVCITNDLTYGTSKYTNILPVPTNYLGSSRETRDSSLALLFSVRPHLGYTTQIWAQQSIELTAKLECIQRLTTRFILNLPYSSTISYFYSRLQTLNLLPICHGQ